MRAWLTPDEISEGTECIALVVPTDSYMRAALLGALLLLADEQNWQKVGGVEPQVCADVFGAVFDSLCEWTPCNE